MTFTPAKFQTKAEMLASESKSEFAAVLESNEIYKLNAAGEYQFISKFSVSSAPPSLPKQAATLGKALANWTASGFHATPPDILAAREATCRACPEWDPASLNNTGRCRICKCSTWAKLRMASERCPLGKWEPVLTAAKN